MIRDASIKKLLQNKFNNNVITNKIIECFIGSVEKYEEGNWENSILKSGKFIEAVVKLIWVFAGKPLPKPKEFKAGLYSQKIINEIGANVLPNEGIRLQIPRACIFVYDICCNRGGRHLSEEFDPNEIDSITMLFLCSWILIELVRFSADETITLEEARIIVESLIELRYPIFEEIGGRIYINKSKHKSVVECSLMILHKRYPNRINRKELVRNIKLNGYKDSAINLNRILPYVDIDEHDNILIRSSGKAKVVEIMKKRK